MKNGVRTHQSASLKVSYSQIMPPHLRGNLREISHVSTPEEDRRKGYATALLNEVCNEADERRIVLMLKADSLELMAWYSKFGFSLLPGDGSIMARAPK